MEQDFWLLTFTFVIFLLKCRYKKIEGDWHKLIKLDAELQNFSDNQAKATMCGAYVKPLCIPFFFDDTEIEYCCDDNPVLKCGNFEGTCDGSKTKTECKDGFECKALNDILRERPLEESEILQRTGWKEEIIQMCAVMLLNLFLDHLKKLLHIRHPILRMPQVMVLLHLITEDIVGLIPNATVEDALFLLPHAKTNFFQMERDVCMMKTV